MRIHQDYFRHILFAFLLLSLTPAFAQGDKANVYRLQIGAAALYERGLEATIGVEHEGRYHNAWEVFGSAYIKWEKDASVGHVTKESFWDSYFCYQLGAAYKPCITRGRNNHGNLRIGAMGGSDTHKFIGGPTLGYEHTYTFPAGWELFWQIKEDIMFRTDDIFRTGVALGVKIPL